MQTEIDYAVAVSPYAVPAPTLTASPSQTVPTAGGPTPTRTQEPGKPGPTRTDEPTQEPGEPTQEPTEPTATKPQPTPRPTKPPSQPCTGVEGFYWIGDWAQGERWITVSVHIVNPDGPGDVYDVHIYINGELWAEQDYDLPMVVCETYWFENIELPAGAEEPEYGDVVIQLTDEDHEVICEHPASPDQW